MKRITSLLAGILCLCLLFTMISCGRNTGNVPEVKPDDDKTVNENSKILVVYFSQPDNVDDSTVEIDGETLGNTQYMAYVIQKNTGANIFRILPETPYPTDHKTLVDLASDEKAQSARPAMQGTIENFDKYDTVFVGYPNWWGDMPMILYTFFDTYDLAGKTVVPFNTHGGSGFSGTVSTIRRLEPDATVLNGLSVSRNKIQDAEQEIIDWVRQLGFEAPETPAVPEQSTTTESTTGSNESPETPSVAEATASLTYEKNGNAYTVTGVTEDVEHIVIPAEYQGLPVTAIGESAFAYSRHNAAIVSVVIPDSVTTIERNAFYNRSEMTTVQIGKDSKLAVLGNNAFSGNHSLKEFYIPASLAGIGDSVFNNDGSIRFTVAEENRVYRSENGHLIERATNTLIRGGQSNVIPDGVTAIAPAAFRKATAITELYIPQSVASIANYWIADSTVTTLNYAGSEEQWNAIEKGKMWNSGNREVKIVYEAKETTESRLLIAYFSWSETTAKLAEHVKSQMPAATLYRIERETPYSTDYSTVAYGEAKEEADNNARPPLKNPLTAGEMGQYDTIIVLYPIWWHTAPMVVGTFLESYDLSGVDVYPITQSASMSASQFDESFAFIKACAAGASVHEGLGTKSTSAIDTYLKANGLMDEKGN